MIYTGQSGYEWAFKLIKTKEFHHNLFVTILPQETEDLIPHATKRTPASNTNLFARSLIQDFTSKNKFEVLSESDDYKDDISYGNQEKTMRTFLVTDVITKNQGNEKHRSAAEEKKGQRQTSAQKRSIEMKEVRL